MNPTSGSLIVLVTQYSVVYPVSGGKQINVVATVYDKSKDGTTWNGPWNTDVSQRELLDTFSEWEEEFQALLKVRASFPVEPRLTSR